MLNKGIFQLYKLGRELGLTKKEIDKIFFYSSFKNRHYGGFILIIILVFIGFLIIFSSLSVPPYIPKNHTYQTGTFYSTVRIKDFNERK